MYNQVKNWKLPKHCYTEFCKIKHSLNFIKYNNSYRKRTPKNITVHTSVLLLAFLI